MTPTTVSTSLIPPTLCYALTTDTTLYHFAHPTYWHPARAAIGMDARNTWGQVEDAKDAFWEYVAASVAWPAASLVAGEIVEAGRLAEIERRKIEAGHISLFD